MRKLNENNERIKRKYLAYLKNAMRKDVTTVQKAAEAILRFEASVGYADFKKFHIEQVIKFQAGLAREVSSHGSTIARGPRKAEPAARRPSRSHQR